MNPAKRGTRPARTLAHRLCLAAAIVALSGIAVMQSVQARPRIAPHVNVSASAESLNLGNALEPGLYHSPAELIIRVAANISYGSVVISATPFQSAEGDVIPPDRILVKLPVTGQFLPLTNPVPISQPVGPGIRELPLMFRIQTEPTDPAGTYTGTFGFLTEPGNIYPGAPGPSVPCTVVLDPHAAISVDPAGMPFGNVTPDITAESVNTPPVSVTTNQRELQIQISMTALDHSDGSTETIPGSMTCLASGNTENEARTNAAQTPFDQNSLVWTCNPGVQTIYLAGRMKVDLGVKPGAYQGKINVMSMNP